MKSVRLKVGEYSIWTLYNTKSCVDFVKYINFFMIPYFSILGKRNYIKQHYELQNEIREK